MTRFKKWVGCISMTAVTAAYFISGCTRNISVTPTVPISVISPTGSPTNTATSTPTNTVVNTPTNSPTGTASFTATSTLTNTYTPIPGAPTNTPTKTQTNSPTSTPSATLTNSSSPTPTNTGAATATPTLTPTNSPVNTATATPCNPASVQTTYTFATSIDCWAVNSTSLPYVTGFGISGSNTYNGAAGALKVSVDNTSGAAQNINVNVTYATPQNLSGMEMIAWIYVDPTLASSTYGTGLQPFDQTGPNWGSAVYEAPWFTVNAAGSGNPAVNVGAWFPVTIVFGATNLSATPSQTLQIGIQLTGVPAGAVGNLYIDDVTIVAAPPTPTGTPTNSPTLTATGTATGSPTDTPAGATSTPTSSPTATVTSTPTATVTNTPTTDCHTVLFNASDTLLDNGVLTTTSANDASPVISSLHATQGTGSINVNVTTYTGYNQFLIVNSVDPSNWSAVTEVLVDVYVDSAIPAGTTWCQLTLNADSTVQGVYGQSISPGSANLVAGSQTVAIPINMGLGTILSTSPLSKLYFILNSGGTAANVGNIYIDNIRLVSSACPPTPIYSWNFDDNTTDGFTVGGWFAGSAGEVIGSMAPGYPGTGYALNDYIPFTGGSQQEALAYTFPSNVDLTGRTIQADLWIDSAINSGYPGGYLFVQSGGWIEEQSPSWTNLSPNAWTRLTFTPTWTAVAGENSTSVQQIGAIFNTGSSGAPGNVKLDNVLIY